MPLSRTARRLVRENLRPDRRRASGATRRPRRPSSRILDSRAPRDAHADGDERGRACSAATCPSGSTSSAAGSTSSITRTPSTCTRSSWSRSCAGSGRGKYERALPELTELVRDERGPPGALPRLPAPRHRQGPRRRPLDRGRRARAALRRAARARGGARASACCSSCGTTSLMSHIAQRRDLSDPKVIVEFARMVGDRAEPAQPLPAHLRRHPRVLEDGWTEWRGELLRELFERTAEFLETGERRPGARRAS